MNNEQERFNELAERVVAWADHKGILEKGTPDAQFGKFLEECTELWKAIVVGDKEQIIDGVGDVAVTIIIWLKLVTGSIPKIGVGIGKPFSPPLPHVSLLLADMIDAIKELDDQDELEFSVSSALVELSFVPRSMLTEDWLDCLEYALNIIEKRTGRMVNGTFVKDVDNALLHD